jgi:hypothetical protein
LKYNHQQKWEHASKEKKKIRKEGKKAQGLEAKQLDGDVSTTR